MQCPHVVACDAGSADFGPFYLGSGRMQKAKGTLKRDLRLLLSGALGAGVPFIAGSAGGAGSAPHLAATVDLVREIGAELGQSFRMATITADLPKALLKSRLREGRLRPLGEVEPLTENRIDNLTAVVGMMGAEPYIEALERAADVIIAGRSTDPAIFAAVPLLMGADPGLAWHAAKCVDKGSLATTRPQEGSPVLARIHDDDFTVEPTRGSSECTVATVAGITLHENADPFHVAQPGGVINTEQAVYTQLDQRRVRVRGSRYDPAAPSIKVEGAELVGFRVILIAGVRDPRLIERFEEFLDAYRGRMLKVAQSFGFGPDDYRLEVRVYGKDAVMGAFETVQAHDAHELGLVVDLVGRTEAIASTLGSRLGPTGSRLDITGKLGGGGNFAYPFSPSVIPVGPVYQWGAWHLMDVEPAELRSLFAVDVQEIRAA